jgi:hypothetical protein
MAVQAALPDLPSFHHANASVSWRCGAPLVDFKPPGLGTVTIANLRLTADASANDQCWNNGGRFPITASPLIRGTFSYPSGQSLHPEGVSYPEITISTTRGGGASTPCTSSSISKRGMHIFLQ